MRSLAISTRVQHCVFDLNALSHSPISADLQSDLIREKKAKEDLERQFAEEQKQKSKNIHLLSAFKKNAKEKAQQHFVSIYFITAPCSYFFYFGEAILTPFWPPAGVSVPRLITDLAWSSRLFKWYDVVFVK